MKIINNSKYNKHTHTNIDNNKSDNANSNPVAMMHPHPNSKQAGYTLVELGLVLIIILILGGVVYAAFTAIYNSAKDQQVEKEVLQFNLALHRCLDRDPSSLSLCGDDKVQLYSGLTSTTTACGDTWSAAPTQDSVVFNYPLSSCEDSDGLGASLESKINQLPNVGALYGASSQELVITGVR